MKESSRPARDTALEDRAATGERQFSPSVARNKDAIRDVFLDLMPAEGKILEIAAGTGEHAVHLAAAAPGLSWHAGDADAQARASIAAWIAHARLPNLKGPHAIDAAHDLWGVEEDAPFDGVVSINMVHIAPFAAAEGLFAGAGRLLREAGALFLYGPFSRGGAHTAPSNEAFDAALRSRDPRWGVRDLERDLLPLAQKNALRLEKIVEMPANNFSVLFRKN